MSLVELMVTGGLGLVVACAMEPWSRFVHGRFWHGALYGIHRTHHPETPGRRWLEVNDVFSLVHGVPAAACLYLGLGVLDGAAAVAPTAIGLGLSGYGLAYTVVHDGLVHGRLPVRFLEQWRYFRRIRGAHEVHHRHGGPPYGLFLGPRELKRARRRSAAAPGPGPALASAPAAGGPPSRGPAQERTDG